MTKKELLSRLTWITGMPPSDYENTNSMGETYTSDGFADNKGPIICEQESDGEIFIVGQSNFLGGVCDCCRGYFRNDVKRYAYLCSDW